MKILLLGGTGFIGSHLKEGFLKAGHTVADPRLEVRDFSGVQKALEEHEPDAVVNATGVTGKPNVDWCETHPGETLSVNVAGSLNVAAACAAKNIHMAQIGSGCIYDGFKEGGFTEEDEPNYFGSLYSRSRMLSEKALREFPNVLQLRIRIPILGKKHPKNLIDKLLHYPKMINRLNSCTVIEDLVPATLQLMEQRATGVFNMTNPGAMDHQSIMRRYQALVDPAYEIRLMEPAEEEKLCERRSNCVLSTDKLKKAGVTMRPLEEALETVLKAYKSS